MLALRIHPDKHLVIMDESTDKEVGRIANLSMSSRAFVGLTLPPHFSVYHADAAPEKIAGIREKARANLTAEARA